MNMASIFKNDFINSIKKWNNVYYYSYDANGNRVENKVINIVEGNKEDYNSIIHPSELENDCHNSSINASMNKYGDITVNKKDVLY